MFEYDYRWSRGCGSGIGLSSQKNEYRVGVNIQNFVEDRQKLVDVETKKHVLGQGGSFYGDSTQRCDYIPNGRYGSEMLSTTERQYNVQEGVPGPKLFQHGNPYQQPDDCHATLYSLNYGEKTIGEPRVQQYLWWGTKFNDKNVPTNQKNINTLTMKQHEWKQEPEFDSFQTTNKLTYTSTAKTTTLHSPKREPFTPKNEDDRSMGGGKKLKGEFVEEIEKKHNSIGLRGGRIPSAKNTQ